MGTFEIKMSKSALGKKPLQAMKKMFGKDIQFHDVTLSLGMDSMPDQKAIEILTEKIKKVDIDIESVQCKWIK